MHTTFFFFLLHFIFGNQNTEMFQQKQQRGRSTSRRPMATDTSAHSPMVLRSGREVRPNQRRHSCLPKISLDKNEGNDVAIPLKSKQRGRSMPHCENAIITASSTQPMTLRSGRMVEPIQCRQHCDTIPPSLSTYKDEEHDSTVELKSILHDKRRATIASSKPKQREGMVRFTQDCYSPVKYKNGSSLDDSKDCNSGKKNGGKFEFSKVSQAALSVTVVLGIAAVIVNKSLSKKK